MCRCQVRGSPCPVPKPGLSNHADHPSVPHLAQLKQACFESIEAYKRCLDTNAAEKDDVVQSRCEGLMRAVWECSERAMAGLDGKQQVGERLV